MLAEVLALADTQRPQCVPITAAALQFSVDQHSTRSNLTLQMQQGRYKTQASSTYIHHVYTAQNCHALTCSHSGQHTVSLQNVKLTVMGSSTSWPNLQLMACSCGCTSTASPILSWTLSFADTDAWPSSSNGRVHTICSLLSWKGGKSQLPLSRSTCTARQAAIVLTKHCRQRIGCVHCMVLLDKS